MGNSQPFVTLFLVFSNDGTIFQQINLKNIHLYCGILCWDSKSQPLPESRVSSYTTFDTTWSCSVEACAEQDLVQAVSCRFYKAKNILIHHKATFHTRLTFVFISFYKIAPFLGQLKILQNVRFAFTIAKSFTAMTPQQLERKKELSHEAYNFISWYPYLIVGRYR